MCGILVLCGMHQPFHHRLLQGLRRRGPDEIGFWVNTDVQMAHARLAIIGLDERATEPLENETHVLNYNGEIYNFPALRDRLASEGVNARGANDAEVLLHAWSKWGPKVLEEIVGFWAFAIYDKRAQKLTLVRDQFGVKPLYYWHSGRQFVASSLIRNIVDVLDTPPPLDHDALSEYVRYQFTFGDKTFLKDVRKVLPGHMVELDVRSGKVTTKRYEDVFDTHPGGEKITPQWIDETRALMQQCILESTVSDTPYTALCSGGIDSSMVTRITRPEMAFHCNYSDPECNETFFAKQAVEGTAIRLFTVNAEENLNIVERVADIVEDFDEPTIGSVILPLEDLLHQVKRRYKVMMTGTGGDELFAGYVRYQLALGQCYQDSYKAMYARLKPIKKIEDRFEATHVKGDPTLYRFYDSKIEQHFREAYAECRKSGDDLTAMLWFDRRYFLAGLLNIDDKMAGRHSLESRPSLLHQKFVRHLMKADQKAFLAADADLKPVLRKLAAPFLPAPITQRKDKMGFTTPVGTFVNKSAHHIREQILNSHFRELYDVKRMTFTAENKFSREVFGLLMLDLWLHRYARPQAKQRAAHA